MSKAFFEKPILNSPYTEPSEHWEFTPEGQPTGNPIGKRRKAEFFTPIPKSRKRSKKSAAQTTLEFQDDVGLSTDKQAYQTNDTIMAIRKLVGEWRLLPESRWNVTPTTQRLLKWWRKDDWPGRRPFFCQVEAVEVMIWLTEVAPGTSTGKRLLEELESRSRNANPDLFRLCLKLATGAGKTTVMAMLIAWHTLNSVRSPTSKRFTRGFLLVAPGITIQRKLGITRVIDLSATPFFLRGSGYIEGTIFGWTCSDFSLMDAIECGIVKLPRVPVADNIPDQEVPVFRDLWENIRKDMPKKSRGTTELDPLSLPTKLQTALTALYGHYEETHRLWKEAGISVPPCFIIVCNNTSTSKLIYDYISGFRREGNGEFVEGRFDLFWNYDKYGEPYSKPNTLLIDSKQLESDDALDDKFLEAAGDEIERFKYEIRQRNASSKTAPDADNLSEADILREVMNTVGEKGKLGESIRCVVSVSMLTEGWEGEFCRVVESHPRVLRYVKNQGLGLEVPYLSGGQQRNYVPDFIVLIDDGHGPDDPLQLIVEVKGYRREDVKDKSNTMKTYWVPGVNKLKAYGRWAFAEFRDVYLMEADFEEKVTAEVERIMAEQLGADAGAGGVGQ